MQKRDRNFPSHGGKICRHARLFKQHILLRPLAPGVNLPRECQIPSPSWIAVSLLAPRRLRTLAKLKNDQSPSFQLRVAFRCCVFFGASNVIQLKMKYVRRQNHDFTTTRMDSVYGKCAKTSYSNPRPLSNPLWQMAKTDYITEQSKRRRR